MKLYDGGFFHIPALVKNTIFMQMYDDAKKSLNRKRELRTGSIDPILFVKYLDTVLSETACAPNQIILMEVCGPHLYWYMKN
jgi:hypothetical protein